MHQKPSSILIGYSTSTGLKTRHDALPHGTSITLRYSLHGIIFDDTIKALAALIGLYDIQASQPHIRTYLHKLVCASKPTVKPVRVEWH